MDDIPDRIRRSVAELPSWLLARSGSVFYSGREAFSRPSDLYIAGLNPGSDPVRQRGETIAIHVAEFRARSTPWSAYADDSWRGAEPGSWGMQPRVRHLLRTLGRDPRTTPASNAIFVRMASEAELKVEKAHLAESCWPVHEAVIRSLGVQVILCFGRTAGNLFRRKLGAHELVASFSERNSRRWISAARRAPDGRVVVTLTHPSRANWVNSDADPSPLVTEMLNSAGRWN